MPGPHWWPLTLLSGEAWAPAATVPSGLGAADPEPQRGAAAACFQLI